jgi:hypothetical protein
MNERRPLNRSGVRRLLIVIAFGIAVFLGAEQAKTMIAAAFAPSGKGFMLTPMMVQVGDAKASIPVADCLERGRSLGRIALSTEQQFFSTDGKHLLSDRQACLVSVLPGEKIRSANPTLIFVAHTHPGADYRHEFAATQEGIPQGLLCLTRLASKPSDLVALKASGRHETACIVAADVPTALQEGVFVPASMLHATPPRLHPAVRK